MAQKTSPILLRSLKNHETSIFQQYPYGSSFIPYTLNEHKSLLFFITSFLRVSQLNLHSFRYSRNYTGTVLILIKYVSISSHSLQSGFSSKTISFFNLEKAFIQGVSKIVKNTPVIVSFLHIDKLDKADIPLPLSLLYFRFFSNIEIENTTSLLLFVKGSAYFLARLISLKLEIMRSKIDRRSQGRFLFFIKTLVNHIQTKNFVGIQGLKISIKGRINGNPRSKIWSVSEGVLSLQKIENEIDFFYTPSFTVYGTFGVKVWINYGD